MVPLEDDEASVCNRKHDHGLFGTEDRITLKHFVLRVPVFDDRSDDCVFFRGSSPFRRSIANLSFELRRGGHKMDEFNVGGGGGMGGMSGAPPPEEDFSKMPIEERLKSKVRIQ